MKLNFEKNDGHPSRKGDPLYEKSLSGVAFGKGEKRIFDENMVPVDELENQNFGQENDPEKTFVPIREIADPDSLNGFDFENYTNEQENEEYGENDDISEIDESVVEKKDLRDVLINGIPLVDIMGGKVSEDELPQRPVKEGFNHIKKISVNRGVGTWKAYWANKAKQLGTRRIKPHKWNYRYNSQNSKQKNINTSNPYKPWKKAQKQIIEGDDPRMTG